MYFIIALFYILMQMSTVIIFIVLNLWFMLTASAPRATFGGVFDTETYIIT